MSKQAIVIIPSWYPNSRDPVAGIFVRQQARALCAAGLKISVFFVEERHRPWDHSWGKVRFELEQDVPTFRLKTFVPPKRIRSLRYYWLQQWDQLIRAYVDRYSRYPELLHAHSFVGGAAAAYLSEKYDIPYVLTEHYSGFISGKIPLHWQADLEKIYGAASQVIAVSPALAAAMSVYVSPVVVIPNMIDTRLFRPAESIGLRPPTKRIISVGSLIPRKNFAALLRVFAQFDEKIPLELTIIGHGPLRGQLERLAQKLDVDERVHFTGSLSSPEVAARLRSADLYVAVSHWESFALAPLEALACGLPVVLLKSGSMLESMPFEATLLVEKESQLEAGISQQLERLDQIDRFALHQQVEAVFAPQVIVDQLKEVYRSLAAF